MRPTQGVSQRVVNISGAVLVDDPFYRYQVPVVAGKIEGRGKKTVILNISDIGSNLHRSPGEVNHFLGCELGARANYVEATGYATLGGAHRNETLQALIHRYIEQFVLCPYCKKPETRYEIKKEMINHRCDACGERKMLVNESHKLCNYILAQDRKVQLETKRKGKKDKGDKKSGGNGSDKDKKKKNKNKNEDKMDETTNKYIASKTESGDKGYNKETSLGKKDDYEIEAEEDATSATSGAGVDDEGARSKYRGTTKRLKICFESVCLVIVLSYGNIVRLVSCFVVTCRSCH
jgi:translation initiation factor 5